MQSLKPAGLPPERRRIVAINCIISIGVENAEWRDGDMQSTPTGTPRIAAISRGDLGGGQNAAMAGFRALTKLELDHLDLIALRALREFLRAERAVAIAATEIAGADFPDQIAAVFAVIGAISAFAGIVSEVALFGADIERADRVRAEGAEAHRRNIEDGSRIGLAAVWPADYDAKRLRYRGLGAIEWCSHS